MERNAQVICSLRAKALYLMKHLWSAASDNAYQLPAANFDTPLKGEVSSFNLKRIRNNYKIEWHVNWHVQENVQEEVKYEERVLINPQCQQESPAPMPEIPNIIATKKTASVQKLLS